MNVDVFWRKFNHDKEKGMAAPAEVVHMEEVDEAVSLDDLLRFALDEGASIGNSWSGIFEVQTDKGIWSRRDGKKLAQDPRQITDHERSLIRFETWEEQEEVEKCEGSSAGSSSCGF